MDPKKNPQADLEGKTPVFFMIGIAVALLMVITVFQYQKQHSIVITKTNTVEANLGPDIPITVRSAPKMPEMVKPVIDVNPNLPPEEVPDNTKLEITSFIGEGPDDDDELREIGRDDFFGKDEVETIEFAVIEKMARPLMCGEKDKIEEQKACFNEWIQDYLSENTNYPELAKQMRLEDRVYVTFVISEKGEVESAVIGRGEYDVLNDEALRVVKSMPEFIPGSQRGKAVKMKITIPVNFKLSSF